MALNKRASVIKMRSSNVNLKKTMVYNGLAMCYDWLSYYIADFVYNQESSAGFAMVHKRSAGMRRAGSIRMQHPNPMEVTF